MNGFWAFRPPVMSLNVPLVEMHRHMSGWMHLEYEADDGFLCLKLPAGMTGMSSLPVPVPFVPGPVMEALLTDRSILQYRISITSWIFSMVRSI
jgi:hypothetical protein